MQTISYSKIQEMTDNGCRVIIGLDTYKLREWVDRMLGTLHIGESASVPVRDVRGTVLGRLHVAIAPGERARFEWDNEPVMEVAIIIAFM